MSVNVKVTRNVLAGRMKLVKDSLYPGVLFPSNDNDSFHVFLEVEPNPNDIRTLCVRLVDGHWHVSLIKDDNETIF